MYRVERNDKMNYTIASLKDIHNNIALDLVQNGNKEEVHLYNEETRELTCSRTLESNEATKLYLKMTEIIIKCEYSYEDRKKMIVEF